MKFLNITVLFLATTLGSFAQSRALEDATIKLFGKNPAFSADLSISSAKGEVAMSGKFYFDHGKTRFEGSLPKNMAPSALAQMQKMGLDKVYSINRSDLQMTYMIYPTLKAYTILDYAKNRGTNTDIKVSTTIVGKEDVEGYSCNKTLVKLTGDGVEHEVTTWNAPKLNDFPIKVTMGVNTDIMTILYTNVNTKTPDAALFEPPTDYTKYSSPQELMKAVFAQKH